MWKEVDMSEGKKEGVSSYAGNRRLGWRAHYDLMIKDERTGCAVDGSILF